MARKRPVIASLFGRSPFTPLQEHMRAVLKCAREVTPLFEALIAGDNDKLTEAKDRIFEYEEEADKIKNELRSHLPKSLFLPVDRRDLLDVLRMQDSIADTAQDIAGILVERQMTVPETLDEPLMELVAACVVTCEAAGVIVEQLDEMVSIGFRGKSVQRVLDKVDALNLLEDETDELGVALARALFQREDDLKPVSVMIWYQLIEWIGDLADFSEKVGDRLRLLVAR